MYAKVTFTFGENEYTKENELWSGDVSWWASQESADSEEADKRVVLRQRAAYIEYTPDEGKTRKFLSTPAKQGGDGEWRRDTYLGRQLQNVGAQAVERHIKEHGGRGAAATGEDAGFEDSENEDQADLEMES